MINDESDSHIHKTNDPVVLTSKRGVRTTLPVTLSRRTKFG